MSATLEKALQAAATILGRTKVDQYPTTKLARAAAEFVGEWAAIQKAKNLAEKESR